MLTVLRHRLQGSVLLLLVSVLLLQATGVDTTRPSLGWLLLFVALLALAGYLISLYGLTRALVPNKPYLAVLSVLTQVIPLIGVPVAFILLRQSRVRMTG